MPIEKLLDMVRPNADQKKQLINDYKHFNGVYVQTKDSAKKAKISRKGYAIQLQLQNFGIKLHKKAKWNSDVQWERLQIRQRRIDR